MSRGKPLRGRLSIAFDADDLQLLRRICEERGESIAAFCRFAALQRAGNLSLFTPERKKASEIAAQ